MKLELAYTQYNSNSPTWAVTILSPLVALAKSREGWKSLTVLSEATFAVRRESDVMLSLGTAMIIKIIMVIIMIMKILIT